MKIVMVSLKKLESMLGPKMRFSGRHLYLKVTNALLQVVAYRSVVSRSVFVVLFYFARLHSVMQD